MEQQQTNTAQQPNSKAALNIWCSKKGLKIDYLIKEKQDKSGFQCDILIQSINRTVGTGQASNKKTASTIAALQALKYLINENYIKKNDLEQSCFQVLNIKQVLFPDNENDQTANDNSAKNNQINKPKSSINNQNQIKSNKTKSAKSNVNQFSGPKFGPGQQDYQYDGPLQPYEPPNYFDGPMPPPMPPDHFLGPRGGPPFNGPRGFDAGPPPRFFDPGPPPRFFDPGPPPRRFFDPGPPPRGFFDPGPPPRGFFDAGPPPRGFFPGPRGQPPPPPRGGYFDGPPPRFRHSGPFEAPPWNQRGPTYYPERAPYPPPPLYRPEHGPRMAPPPNCDPNLQYRTRKLPPQAGPELTGMENLNINSSSGNGNVLDCDYEDSTSSGTMINRFDLKKRKPNYNSDNSIRTKLKWLEDECHFNMDNAKQQLHMFCQANKIKADYVFREFGPAHSKTFIAKLRIHVPHNNKEYEAEEHGDSKQDASRLCALNMLHQLYVDKLVDCFEPDAFSKRKLLKMSFIYTLELDPSLTSYLSSTSNYIFSYNNFAAHLQLLQTSLNQPSSKPSSTNNNFLYWCPPLENFNPWTNSNLDNTSWAGKTKQQINQELHQEFQSMIKSPRFQNILRQRMLLPIWHYKQQLIELIENHPVVIIKGSTGCGKTTQVSQFILDSYIKACNGANCNIVVTQPRRISAISIAERIAYERGSGEGLIDGKSVVGYAVRFDHVYPRPYGSILFCTTGHLLRRIQGGLKGVSHLIIDEVHERDINTDLLLIIIRDLIQLDLNIHVVIMSATIGVEHFQKYFRCNQVVEIDNQLFPVQRYYLEEVIEMIKWKPKSLTYIEDDVEIMDDSDHNTNQDSNQNPNRNSNQDPNSNQNRDLNMNNPSHISASTHTLLTRLKEGYICIELIVSILEHIHHSTITGSILIFLPGWNSIFSLLNILQRNRVFGDESRYLLIPLHSQLSHKENNRIFQKCPMRKIILATNIAETSITINDVVFVVDTCLMKRKIYDSKVNASTYAIDMVSKSNVQQRQGRAGRLGSGYHFVLITRKRFESLEEYKRPEILVSSLVETCLLIKYLGFGSVEDFLARALDPPAPKQVKDSLQTLRVINALDHNDDLTPLGTILAKMPIDPKIGRMIMESIMLGVAAPIITIAAASCINYELFDCTDLDLLHQTLIQLDEERYSDHLIVFKVYDMCDKSTQSTSQSSQYRCINMNAINVVDNARKQLVSILTKCGFKEELFQRKASYLYSSQQFDLIAALLITGFYPNVCLHKDTRRILTNEERIGLIHKTSVFYSYVHYQKNNKLRMKNSDLESQIDKLRQENSSTTKSSSSTESGESKQPNTGPKSPLFIYSEKSQTKNLISSKQMTMISFLQLMLFGVKIFEYPSGDAATVQDTILLDGWIQIKIQPEIFDYILQLKSEFEKLIMKYCTNPKYENTELDTTVLNAIALLCLFDNVNVKINANK